MTTESTARSTARVKKSTTSTATKAKKTTKAATVESTSRWPLSAPERSGGSAAMRRSRARSARAR